MSDERPPVVPVIILGACWIIVTVLVIAFVAWGGGPWMDGLR